MRTIETCNKEYELYWVTGEVAESGKSMETKVHGSGGGSYGNGYTAPVNIRSTTTVHDQIFMIDREGKEHAFQLQDFHVACRSGNQLSVLWAVRKGKRTGPYIAVHNKTTSQTYFQDSELKKIFSYSIWYPVGIALLCLLLHNILPYWGLLMVVPFVAWVYVQRKEVKRFKAETDFNSFN